MRARIFELARVLPAVEGLRPRWRAAPSAPSTTGARAGVGGITSRSARRARCSLASRLPKHSGSCRPWMRRRAPAFSGSLGRWCGSWSALREAAGTPPTDGVPEL
jgi:hypothetical protein